MKAADTNTEPGTTKAEATAKTTADATAETTAEAAAAGVVTGKAGSAAIETVGGAAIETVGLGKRFGPVTALDGVDLTVPRETVLCLLGHNGAGKSTLVDILTTLARPTSGTARVAGFDVVAEAHRVRRSIGVAGQFAALDDRMTPRATLVLLARLHGLGRRAAQARADELLDVFGLGEFAGRPLRACSGGTRRRLDLAAGLTGRPEVVVLDEPTAGLDPVSRMTLWEVVRGLAQDGAAVLLTTQDLAEADRLADVIAVLRRGRLVASGTPGELKARVGSRAVTVRPADLGRAERVLRADGIVPAFDPARGTLTVPAASSRQVTEVLRALDAAGIDPGDLSLSEPGLDEVYLALATGHPRTHDTSDDKPGLPADDTNGGTNSGMDGSAACSSADGAGGGAARSSADGAGDGPGDGPGGSADGSAAHSSADRPDGGAGGGAGGGAAQGSVNGAARRAV